LKNVENGSVLENTFRAGEKVPQAIIEKDDMQYLFKSGDNFTMMNTSTYEQTEMEEDKIGTQAEFLKEGLEGITVMKYDGRVIGVELPNSVELEITDCAPDERGDTSSGGGKPATLETGAVITVPFHIKIGDKVKVDTRTRKYVTRV
jgi:elongation factor P